MRPILKHISISAICIIAAIGCAGTGSSTQSLTVNIDEIVSSPTSVFDLFSQVELVHLDSSGTLCNSVWSGSPSIAMGSGRIYILDRRQIVVNSYDLNGQLICHSAKKGRGPGETTIAEQIMFNKALGMVEILDPSGRIIRYTPDSLQFVSLEKFSESNPHAVHRFLPIMDDYLFYSITDNCKLWKFDNDDRTFSSFRYDHPEYESKYMCPEAPVFEMDGVPCMFSTIDGTVYSLDIARRRVHPSATWNLGHCSADRKDIARRQSSLDHRKEKSAHEFVMEYSRKHVSPFIDMKHHDGVFYSTVIYEGVPHSLIHAPKDGRSFFFEKTSEGMRFLPEIFDGDMMYKLIDFSSLPEYVNREILDKASQDAYDKTLGNGGCAIVKYHIKQ